MTISERIFELLDKRGMSQKEFSEKTGIAQSSISDWKRKKTNPVSEKILIICSVLDVTVYGVPKRNADRPAWGNCAAAGGNINRRKWESLMRWQAVDRG